MAKVATQAFQTPLGEVWLSGEPQAFTDGRPVVLAIAGAFAPSDAFDQLALRLPQAAVFVAHLPGNRCPWLVANSIGSFATAYGHALDQLARPAVVCGSSVGALVAMGLRSSRLKGLVVLEPPLRTAKLWPLIPRLRALLRDGADAETANFVWSVFGVSDDAVEERDYAALLDRLRTPTWCILGEAPLLPPRAVSPDPSYVDEPERALLRAHPAIRIQVAPSVGHNVQGEAGQLVMAAIRNLLG